MKSRSTPPGSDSLSALEVATCKQTPVSGVLSGAGPRRYVRAKTACEYFQIARSTLWLWAKTRPGFPQPLKAGEKVTLFDLIAIENFLRLQERNGAESVVTH